jgi:hypothetical protein
VAKPTETPDQVENNHLIKVESLDSEPGEFDKLNADANGKKYTIDYDMTDR